MGKWVSGIGLRILTDLIYLLVRTVNRMSALPVILISVPRSSPVPSATREFPVDLSFPLTSYQNVDLFKADWMMKDWLAR